MRAQFWARTIAAVCVVAVFSFALHQWVTNDALRAEARRIRAQAVEIETLRAEQTVLSGQQVPGEMDALREASREAPRLRVEAAELRRRVEQAEKADQSASTTMAAEPAAEFVINAGRATPLAVVQTAVWATQHGDTDALAGLIAFDAAGRALVDGLFAGLPEEMRGSIGSAEKVFATLLAVRLPQDLSSAHVITAMTPTGNDFTVGMRLKRTGGEIKDASLRFSPDAGGWRLMVPAKVVENYLATLNTRIPIRPNSSSLLSSPFMVE